MSLGTDALTLVKDVKKFEAQLAKLAKAENSASSAIDSANRKADAIIAEARLPLHHALVPELQSSLPQMPTALWY